MEYRDAAKGAVEGGRSAEAYQRVSRSAADDLAIDPETLQETGWGAKLFGLAALGGIGYLVHENLRKDKKLRERSHEAPRQAECRAGTELVDDAADAVELGAHPSLDLGDAQRRLRGGRGCVGHDD
jgi:hypothetical protein